METKPGLRRDYKYLDLLILIFVVILLTSNLIAAKFTAFGSLRVSAAMLLFPVTYIFGDVFTEVYGYGASRKAIWRGFFASGLLTAMGLFAIWLPSAPEFKNQAAFEIVFGAQPRIVAGSLLAFWFGEFANSYTLAKLKLITQGRYLWTRTVSSTIVGQGVDTTIVTCFIFYDSPWETIGKLILTGYVLKVVYEVLATPVTYAVVNFLKRQEGIDVFDRDTNFSPFTH